MSCDNLFRDNLITLHMYNFPWAWSRHRYTWSNSSFSYGLKPAYIIYYWKTLPSDMYVLCVVISSRQATRLVWCMQDIYSVCDKTSYLKIITVIMSAIASQITSVFIVCSCVCSGADQRNHQSSTSPLESPHKGPVTRKMFPFDDVIFISRRL